MERVDVQRTLRLPEVVLPTNRKDKAEKRMGMGGITPFSKEETLVIRKIRKLGLGKKQEYIDIKQEFAQWKKIKKGV
ncbi:hypothetical protein ABFW39_002861 [Listeria monocytogenes]|nr:hypothetical protein [Listeria monocytogenes]MBC1462015.1 hypothetical protein [Listeria welshimeri]EAC4362811.1 hypothetical protein [Listeria monocytogenes]EAD4958551.1 hypothetical protein [Listeria monocytogenes]EGB9983145.1 hypothetical protein [Listeria monocytogenes]